jgi:mannosyltransferase
VAEMLLAAAVPLALLCAVSVAGPSFWVVRYVLFVLMPAAVVAAAGIVQAGAGLHYPAAALRVTLVLAVVAGTALPDQRAVRQPTVKNGSDYRTLAGLIQDRQAPGDVIVYGGGRTMRPGVGYYLRTDAGAPPDILQAESAGQAGTLTAREFPDPAARLAGADRIWLMIYGHRADPATARPDLAPLLRSRYRLVESWRVKGATMALYAARG